MLKCIFYGLWLLYIKKWAILLEHKILNGIKMEQILDELINITKIKRVQPS